MSRRVLGVMVAAALAGCSGGAGGTDDGGTDTPGCSVVFYPDGGQDPSYLPDAGERQFTAFACAFRDYRSWTSFELDSDFNGGNVHASGPRTEYINRPPPHGSASFPVGTIIVKELRSDGFTFAMVKRGGSFNSAGAPGWEWFEIGPDGGAPVGTDVVIQWRGVGPPAGETYGGDPTTCNACHQSAGNDSVPSPALQLGNF